MHLYASHFKSYVTHRRVYFVEEYFPNRRKYKKQSYSSNAGSIDSIQNSNTFRFANKKISLDTGAILGQLGFKLFEFAQYAVLSSIG